MKENKPILFDKTEQFERQARPTMDELVMKCASLQLPMFIVIAVACREEDGKYRTEYVKKCFRSETDVIRGKDMLSGLLMRTLGCNVTLPKYIVNAAMEIQDYLDTTDSDYTDNVQPNEAVCLEIMKILALLDKADAVPDNVAQAVDTLRTYCEQAVDQKKEELPNTMDSYLSDCAMIAAGNAEVTMPEDVTGMTDMPSSDEALSITHD